MLDLNRKGSEINSLTTTYGLQQLTSDPNHMLQNSSTYIDLIFTDQINSYSGLHPSLHTNCYHHLTYYKLNLVTEYQPPYLHLLVWDYKIANISSNKQALYQINWSTI